MSGGGDERKRILDRWEPVKYSRMVRSRSSLVIVPDIDAPVEDMLGSLLRVMGLADARMQLWVVPPTLDLRDALMVVAFCVVENPALKPTNDLLAIRIGYLLMGLRYRAHPHGVYYYLNGAFRRVEELQDVTMRRFEFILTLVQKLFCVAAHNDLPRGLNALFEQLEPLCIGVEAADPVCSSDLVAKK